MLIQIFIYLFLFWVVITLLTLGVITLSFKAEPLPNVPKGWPSPEEFSKIVDEYLEILQKMQKE